MPLSYGGRLKKRKRTTADDTDADEDVEEDASSSPTSSRSCDCRCYESNKNVTGADESNSYEGSSENEPAPHPVKGKHPDSAKNFKKFHSDSTLRKKSKRPHKPPFPEPRKYTSNRKQRIDPQSKNLLPLRNNNDDRSNCTKGSTAREIVLKAIEFGIDQGIVRRKGKGFEIRPKGNRFECKICKQIASKLSNYHHKEQRSAAGELDSVSSDSSQLSESSENSFASQDRNKKRQKFWCTRCKRWHFRLLP